MRPPTGVVDAVQREGTCWVGPTTWQGRRAIRFSVSDQATTDADIDASVDAILRCWRGVEGFDEAGADRP